MTTIVVDEEDPICCICSEVNKSDSIVSTNCGHRYHLSCLLKWSQLQNTKLKSTTCPICREELVAAPQNTINESVHFTIEVQNEMQEEMSSMLQSLIGNRIDTMQLYNFLGEQQEGNIQRIVEMIDEHPDVVHQRRADGTTPLMHSIYLDDNEAADLLIERGSDIKATDNYMVSVLHIAALMKNVPILKKLLMKRANIDVRDKNGETPLFYALRMKSTSIVNILLRKGADVNIVSNTGATIFHLLASDNTNHNILHSLKNTNALCLSQTDFLGNTVLHKAADNNNIAFVKKFMPILPKTLKKVSNHTGDVIAHMSYDNDAITYINEYVYR